MIRISKYILIVAFGITTFILSIALAGCLYGCRVKNNISNIVKNNTLDEIKKISINDEVPKDIKGAVDAYLRNFWPDYKELSEAKSELYYIKMEDKINIIEIEAVEIREAKYINGGPKMETMCNSHFIILRKNIFDKWAIVRFSDGCEFYDFNSM